MIILWICSERLKNSSSTCFSKTLLEANLLEVKNISVLGYNIFLLQNEPEVKNDQG